MVLICSHTELINTGGEISHGGRYIVIYLLHHERICQDQAEKSELCSK